MEADLHPHPRRRPGSAAPGRAASPPSGPPGAWLGVSDGAPGAAASSRQILGNWVVLPEPVSPQTMTTGCRAISSAILPRRSLTGRSAWKAGRGELARRAATAACDFSSNCPKSAWAFPAAARPAPFPGSGRAGGGHRRRGNRQENHPAGGKENAGEGGSWKNGGRELRIIPRNRGGTLGHPWPRHLPRRPLGRRPCRRPARPLFHRRLHRAAQATPAGETSGSGWIKASSRPTCAFRRGRSRARSRCGRAQRRRFQAGGHDRFLAPFEGPPPCRSGRRCNGRS